MLRRRWQQLKIKARVLARKNILVSDPVVQQMTPTRWLFEAWQVKLEDTRQVEIIQQVGEQAVKHLLEVVSSVLGTNLEPIGEPDPTNPEKTMYRWPKQGEFTPLIFAVARPDYLKSAFEKISQVQGGDLPAAPGGVDLDQVTEEDLQFFDDMPIDEKKSYWDSMEAKRALQELVIPLDPSQVDPYSPTQPKPKGPDLDRIKRDLVQEARGRGQGPGTPFSVPKKRPGLRFDDDLDALDDLTPDLPDK